MRQRRRLLGWAALALWLGGTVTALSTMYLHVRTEPVCLHLADGTPIHGTLYRPRSDENDRAAAILIHGTGMSHRACAPGLAAPLAHHGYLVLAIDLQGHGWSGGGLPREQLDSITSTPTATVDHPEVEAAVDYINRHPQYIKHHPVGFACLGLVGHSRGAWIAADVGRHREDVYGVVCLGSAPMICNQHMPHNVLFITGRDDRLCPLANSTEALARATGGLLRQMEVPFGNFWTGNARRMMLVNSTDHLTELADPDISSRVIEWLDTSLHMNCMEHRSKREVVFTLVGVLAATLGWLVFSTLVLGHMSRRLLAYSQLFRISVAIWVGAPPPGSLCAENRLKAELPPSPIAKVWPNDWKAEGTSPLRLAIFLALAIGWTVLAAWIAPTLEFGPAYLGGPSVALLSGLGVLGLAVAWTRKPVETHSTSAAADWSGWELGIAALGLAIVGLGIPWGLTWLELVPTPRRFVLLLVLAILLAPGAWAVVAAVERLTAMQVGIGASLQRSAAWVGLGVVIWLANHFLVVDQRPLFILPVELLVAGLILSLPLWWLPTTRGSTAARALYFAAGLSWLTACHLPFVHGG